MKKIIVTMLIVCFTLPMLAQSVSDMLPQNVSMVMMIRSLSHLLDKLNDEKHGDILIPIRQETSRKLFDITSVEAYKKNGIDPTKNMGFAMLDQEMKVLCFFIPIQDGKTFRNFFDKIVPSTISKPCPMGGNFLIQGTEEVANVIHYIANGYWMIITSPDWSYAYSGKLLPTTISAFSSEKKLSQYVPFQDCQKNLEGNFFLYMDYAVMISKTMGQAMQNVPQDQQFLFKNVEKVLQEFTAFGMTAEWMKDKVQISYFLGVKEGSPILAAYTGENNCKDMLLKMAPNPLFLLVTVGDLGKVWDINKEYINSMLKVAPLPENMQDMDALLNMIGSELKRNLNISLDIENDLIKNFQGSSIIALYNLPKDMSMDFDLVMIMKLKNPKVMQKILEDLVGSLKQKFQELPLVREESENSIVYVVEIAKVAPIQVNPSMAVVGDYFIFASKKAMISNIMNGKGNLLENVKNPMLAKGLEAGFPSTGYIRVAEIMQQVAKLVPSEKLENALMFTNHFQEVNWVSIVLKNGIGGFFNLEADGDILEKLILEVKNLEKKMQEKYSQEEQSYQEEQEYVEPEENENGETIEPENPTNEKSGCDCEDCIEEDCPCSADCDENCDCGCNDEE